MAVAVHPRMWPLARERHVMRSRKLLVVASAMRPMPPKTLYSAVTCSAGMSGTVCEARVRGEGQVQGSVEGGGILRETVTLIPAK